MGLKVKQLQLQSPGFHIKSEPLILVIKVLISSYTLRYIRLNIDWILSHCGLVSIMK